jgi:hypothetical protein
MIMIMKLVSVHQPRKYAQGRRKNTPDRIIMCQRRRLSRASRRRALLAEVAAIYDITVANEQSPLPPSSLLQASSPPSLSPFSLASVKLRSSPLPRSAKLAPRLQDFSLLLTSDKLRSSPRAPLPSSAVQEGILILKSFHCHMICHLTSPKRGVAG